MNKYAVRQSPLAVIIGSVLAGGSVQAATITVTTLEDNTVAGQCSLREAIINANANDQSGSVYCAAGDGDDEIVFAAPLAGGTIALNGTNLPFVTENLSISGPVDGDPSAMTIDGNDASRIFILSGSPVFTVELSNLTLTGGRAFTGQSGGAIASFSAHVQLNDVVITGNTASIEGGGVSILNGHDVLMLNTVVSNNSTTGTFGRGGGLSVTGNAFLGNSTISGNTTVGNGNGGGMAVSENALLLFSEVSGNSTAGESAHGGGLAIAGNSVIKYSTVSDNSTAGASAVGGGIFAEGEISIGYSTVANNATIGTNANGGGLFADGGDVLLLNSTFSGNSVEGSAATGGGLYVSDAVATLTHATVAFNSAASGTGGIHHEGLGHLEIYNSLIVQTAGAACNVSALAVVNSLSTDALCTGTATASAAIALGPLADNGGDSQTHALNPASVAINAAGDCETSFGVTTDQRGFPRPGVGPGASAACDIGAFEVQDEQIFRDRFEQ